MVASPLQAARRLFVKVLLASAVAYNLNLATNRDTNDQALNEDFRKAAKEHCAEHRVFAYLGRPSKHGASNVSRLSPGPPVQC